MSPREAALFTSKACVTLVDLALKNETGRNTVPDNFLDNLVETRHLLEPAG